MRRADYCWREPNLQPFLLSSADNPCRQGLFYGHTVQPITEGREYRRSKDSKCRHTDKVHRATRPGGGPDLDSKVLGNSEEISKNRKRRSSIWLHFNHIGDYKAECTMWKMKIYQSTDTKKPAATSKNRPPLPAAGVGGE